MMQYMCLICVLNQLLVVGGYNLGKDPKRDCRLPINLSDIMLTIYSHFYMD